MKKIITFITLILSLTSCETNNAFIKKVLSGKHELRKLSTKTVTEEYASGTYFLIMGSMSYSKTENTTIRFYFKNHRGEFQFMEKPFNEVNIKIEPTLIKPYITFNYDSGEGAYNEESVYSYYVNSVVIHCNEEDFQPSVDINSLK